MNKIIISPSILGYESNLEDSFEKIRKIISAGIEWLHIDIMRNPFIPGKNVFSEKLLSRLYNELKNEVNFDFHLMVSNPDELIEFIDSIVDDDKKKNTFITIHREAYRENLGEYDSKEFDLMDIETGDSDLDKKLGDINIEYGKLVFNKLKEIKDKGFKAGLALEPETSLKNISDEMYGLLNMVLLMGVSSGTGGQSYREEVTNKIKELRNMHEKLMIQVDGGMNEDTIKEVTDAGANNIVVGSYITKAENPVEKLNLIFRHFS